MNKVKNFILENKKPIFVIISVVIILWLFYYFTLSSPSDFPVNKVITIENGTPFKQVAADFEERNLVRSSFWFDTLGWFLMSREDTKAGEYFFEKPQSACALFKKITSGGMRDFIKITIPEGFSLYDIAFFFENKGMWQAEELWEITGLPATENSLEGYLFPDTYYVPTNITPDSFVEMMKEAFEKKTIPEMREKDILTMASILEKEESNLEDKKLIAGILWKRIDAGMALQVDAVFPYIIGKNSYQLTLDDLKTDSPYNTYLYKGLPPGPIANPGLESLEAALNPTDSAYWYYLSDKNGQTYYSKTYEEHLRKKERYLN
ncbi:MAG: endolytic transglycosylase MltG [Patescibacteria group bacterium]